MDLFDKVSKKTLQFKAGSKIFWNGYDHIGAPAGMEQQLAFWRKSQEIFSVSCMTLSTPDEVKVPHQNISKKQTKKKILIYEVVSKEQLMKSSHLLCIEITISCSQSATVANKLIS